MWGEKTALFAAPPLNRVVVIENAVTWFTKRRFFLPKQAYRWAAFTLWCEPYFALLKADVSACSKRKEQVITVDPPKQWETNSMAHALFFSLPKNYERELPAMERKTYSDERLFFDFSTNRNNVTERVCFSTEYVNETNWVKGRNIYTNSS